MKFTFVFISILFSINSFAQKTTYSKYEAEMISYAKNGLVNATRYDSLQIAKTTLDSCWRFVKAYPHSFAKPNVFAFMFELTLDLTNKKNKIFPLIDSVLAYDKSAVTGLRIGEILIEKNLDITKGRSLIIDAFPYLTNSHDKYRAYLSMARSDITLGFYASAEQNYKKSLAIEPDRLTAWYEYLGFTKIQELSQTASYIESKISKLEDNANVEYADKATVGPNINKTVSKISLTKLNGKSVELKKYKGKVVVINRFGFWCSYCLKEFPTLKKMIIKFPEVVFLFINTGDSVNQIRNIYLNKPKFKFLKREKIFIYTKEYSDKIYGQSVPHTLVVDKSGKIRYEYLGYNKNFEQLLKKDLSNLVKKQ